MSNPTPLASWPPITITQAADSSVTIAVASVVDTRLPASPQVHRQAMDRVIAIARHYGRSLPLEATDAYGTFHMIVHPDGHVDESGHTTLEN